MFDASPFLVWLVVGGIVAAIVLAALKLFGVITWSWGLVLLPLAPLVLVGCAVLWFFMTWDGR
jgi:hypothetical protein